MFRALRYTRAALLVFGLGLMLGFAVVVIGGHPRLERVASAVMALALVSLPLALIADGKAMAVAAWLRAGLFRPKRRRPRSKSRPMPTRRALPAKPPGRAARGRRG